MMRAKLGTCIAEAGLTLAGSTYLSLPAAASMLCSADEYAFAQAYADEYCIANGYQGGTVTSCASDGTGATTIGGMCY